MYELRQITFEEILPIWQEYLWPSRKSEITQCSSIVYNKHPFYYNVEYQKATPSFFGIFFEDKIAGVNSGHATADGYRTRGLFVLPEHHGNGLGVTLLQRTIKQGLQEGCKFCWSIPRASSISSYLRAGFYPSSVEFSTETSEKNLFVSTIRIK